MNESSSSAIGSELVARRDFKATSAKHLTFFKGDIMTIIEDKPPATTSNSTSTNDSKQDNNTDEWCLAKHYDGREGLVPLSHLQKRTEVKISSMPWFHGKITRDEAEHLLQPTKVSINPM